MRGGALEALTPMKRILVAGLPIVAIVAPIVVGILDAPRVRAASFSRILEQEAVVEFEVAWLKVNKSGLMGKVSIQMLPGGRFSAENVTLGQLIRNAYNLQDSQLSGGPKWLDDDRFDIVAKAGGPDRGDPFLAEPRGQPSRGQLMLRA